MHLSFISLTIALLDSSARAANQKEGIVFGRADGGPREMEREEEAWRNSLARMAAASRDVCSRTFAVRTRQPHSGDLKTALIYGGIDPARQKCSKLCHCG
jgi:hypothetical protein